MTQYPPFNLPNEAVKWGRAIQSGQESQAKNLSSLEQTVNNEARNTSGQLEVLSRQIQHLGDLTSNLIQLTDRLANAGEFYSDTSGGFHNGSGWRPSRPSITAMSLSGRFQVTVRGTAAGVMSYFTFSAPGYARDRIIGGTAQAEVDRVSGAGGASTAMTVQGSWIASFAPGSEITFYGEAYGTSTNSSNTALFLQVQPLF